VRSHRSRPIRRPSLQTGVPGTSIPGTSVPGARVLGTESLRTGARVPAETVQLRIQRERPYHVRREKPVGIQRRQERERLLQSVGGGRHQEDRRVHRRRLRFQRRGKEGRRPRRARLQTGARLQTSRRPVQTVLIHCRPIQRPGYSITNMYRGCHRVASSFPLILT